MERPARKKRAAREAPEWKPERFAAFWEAWPRGENKQAAIRAWDRLRPDDALLQVMALAFQRQMASPMWQRGVGIPYASTWLNGRRWEDEERDNNPQDPAPQPPRRFHFATIDGEEVVIYDD